MGITKLSLERERKLPLGRTEARSARVEFRLTLSHRLALDRIAIEKRRTISSLADEWIDDLIAKNPPPK